MRCGVPGRQVALPRCYQCEKLAELCLGLSAERVTIYAWMCRLRISPGFRRAICGFCGLSSRRFGRQRGGSTMSKPGGCAGLVWHRCGGDLIEVECLAAEQLALRRRCLPSGSIGRDRSRLLSRRSWSDRLGPLLDGVG